MTNSYRVPRSRNNLNSSMRYNEDLFYDVESMRGSDLSHNKIQENILNDNRLPQYQRFSMHHIDDVPIVKEASRRMNNTVEHDRRLVSDSCRNTLSLYRNPILREDLRGSNLSYGAAYESDDRRIHIDIENDYRLINSAYKPVYAEDAQYRPKSQRQSMDRDHICFAESRQPLVRNRNSEYVLGDRTANMHFMAANEHPNGDMLYDRSINRRVQGDSCGIEFHHGLSRR